MSNALWKGAQDSERFYITCIYENLNPSKSGLCDMCGAVPNELASKDGEACTQCPSLPTGHSNWTLTGGALIPELDLDPDLKRLWLQK